MLASHGLPLVCFLLELQDSPLVSYSIWVAKAIWTGREGNAPGYVTGTGAGSTSPSQRRMGGPMGMARGPAAPMTTDQKSAGFSRAAQRQYLRGVDQKRGAADMVARREGVSTGGRWWVCDSGLGVSVAAVEKGTCASRDRQLIGG